MKLPFEPERALDKSEQFNFMRTADLELSDALPNLAVRKTYFNQSRTRGAHKIDNAPEWVSDSWFTAVAFAMQRLASASASANAWLPYVRRALWTTELHYLISGGFHLPRSLLRSSIF